MTSLRSQAYFTPSKGLTPAQWRQVYSSPPTVRLETVGTYCPLDDTLLRVRLDGWGCPVCSAAWDFRGLSGRWLPLPDDAPASDRLRRLDRRLAATAGAGFGGAVALVAGLQLQPFAGEIPGELFWGFALVLLAVAGVLLAWPRLAARVERARYAGSVVSGTDDGTVQALAVTAAPEVSDER